MLDTFIVEQVQTFALTVGLGILIGAFFDCIRAARAFIRISRRTEFFIDVTFWILMTLLVFIALLSSNWGEVRAYVFIGLTTGGLLYALAFSRLLYKVMVKTLDALVRFARFIARPLAYLLTTVRKTIRRVRKRTARIASLAKKFTSSLQRKKKE